MTLHRKDILISRRPTLLSLVASRLILESNVTQPWEEVNLYTEKIAKCGQFILAEINICAQKRNITVQGGKKIRLE